MSKAKGLPNKYLKVGQYVVSFDISLIAYGRLLSSRLYLTGECKQVLVTHVYSLLTKDLLSLASDTKST